jgi:hypothetical protein
MRFGVRTFIVSLIIAALVGITVPSMAGSGVNSEAYKKAYASAIKTGKNEAYAKIYAQGYAEAKESGATDSRSAIYADAYMRAYSSAREQGRKCPYDCEAYATDYALREMKSK